MSPSSELAYAEKICAVLSSAITDSLVTEISLVRFFPEIFLATAILVLILHMSLLSTARFLDNPLLTQSLTRLCFLILGLTF
jgi:hypothetical protein